MKLSKETINIFKNYSSINSNLLLKEGNKIATKSEPPTIASEVVVSENFPSEFGIYDLNEFLGALSLFNDPELTFYDKYVTIEENGNLIRFYAADASILSTPKNSITFPSVDVEFTLSGGVLANIHRTSSILKAGDLSFIGKDGNLILQVCDKKVATGNTYENVIGNTDQNFRVNVKIDNLKLMPGDYKVSISSKKISRFESTNSQLVYYVAVESDSTFD